MIDIKFVKKKTKILIVNTTPFGPGGIRKVIVNYYRQINKDPFLIDIISIDEQMSSHDEKMFYENNSNVYILRRDSIFRYVKDLYRLCKCKKYDVIHVHGNSATMAIELVIAKICGIKNRIAHCHTTQCTHEKVHKLLFPLFKRSYTYALACSREAGEWIFGNNQFEVLKNAMNLDEFFYSENIRKEYRNKLSLTENVILLGHIGFFNNTKNQEFLIELLYDLAKELNVFLMLIGKGYNQEAVIEKAKKLNVLDRILFMNARDDVNMLLQAMDLFLFPSKWEGLGLALMEAQLTGLECIASTNVPKETNISGNVSFISLNDKEEWERMIVEKLDNTGREERMIDAHRKMNEAGYDIRTEVAKLESIYQM